MGKGVVKNSKQKCLYLMQCPLEKICYFLDCKLMYKISMKFLSKRDFLAKFALCAVRLAVDRKEEG